MSELLLDRAGRRRSPATLPDFRAGQAPANKGLRYPADPPKVEEIIAVMRTAGDGTHGRRLSRDAQAAAGYLRSCWRSGAGPARQQFRLCLEAEARPAFAGPIPSYR